MATEDSFKPGLPQSTGRGNPDAGINQFILDSCPLAIIVIDSSSAFIDCNGAALSFFGTSVKKDILLNPFLYSTPIQPNGTFSGEAAKILVRDAMEKEEVVSEWMFRNKSWEPIPSEITIKKIDFNNTYILIMYIRDLREENRAQAAVKEITERNKIMIDATPVCFVFFSDAFEVVDCNPAALSLFGIPTTEEFKDTFFDLCPEYQQDGKLSSERYKEHMMDAFNDGRKNLNGSI